VAPILETDTLRVDLDAYAGGVGLWGAVPPIFDTTRKPLDRGVHVHARSAVGGSKVIDETYRAVRVVSKSRSIDLTVSELDAIYYMVTSVFGYPMKHVECAHCAHPHLDKDWFSVHAHRGHLCSGCGKHFRDSETAIGNPAWRLGDLLGWKRPAPRPARRTRKLRQVDYPGGIQIWGSNQAIAWTNAAAEEYGIHVHAFTSDKKKPDVDDTFSMVEIDGVTLEPASVRVMMAQNSLPHIAGRVVHVRCTSCGASHVDEGELAFTPHVEHVCEHCGAHFTSRGRLRKTIGNPVVDHIDALSQTAVRPPQQLDLGLIPETL
jgi:transposase-like protein